MKIDARKAAYICSAAALSLAVAIICIGSAWRYRAPDAEREEIAAVRKESPAMQMAMRLMREGRASLRRGSVQRAAYFLRLAEFFDPKADAGSLDEGIGRRLNEIERAASDEAEDAGAAGDAVRLSRARAKLEQLHKER